MTTRGDEGLRVRPSEGPEGHFMKCSGRVMACGGCVIATEGNRPEGRYIVHFATETVLASRLEIAQR